MNTEVSMLYNTTRMPTISQNKFCPSPNIALGRGIMSSTNRARNVYVLSIRGQTRLVCTMPLRPGDFLGHVFGEIEHKDLTDEISRQTHFIGPYGFALRPSLGCMLSWLIPPCGDMLTPRQNVVVAFEDASTPNGVPDLRWPTFALEFLPAFTELVGVPITHN